MISYGDVAVCGAVVVVLVFSACFCVVVGASADGAVNSLGFEIVSHVAYFTASVAFGASSLAR